VIFFSEKKLARKLHEGQVTEKEQMIYLVILNLSYATLLMDWLSSRTLPPAVNVYSYIIDLSVIFSMVVTPIYCALINRRGDNKDLIARYACVSIPILIKLFPLACIFGIVTFFADNLSILSMPEFEDPETPSDVIDSLLLKLEPGPFTAIGALLITIFSIWRYKVNFMIASGRVELK